MKKGFTLIELLVVISIIGLLASVALASLKTARDKAADATIKSNLSGIRTQAEVYYDNNDQVYSGDVGFSACSDFLGDYVFGDPNIELAITSTETIAGEGDFGYGVMCGFSPERWVVIAALRSASQFFWCVDSTGNSKPIPDGDDLAVIISNGPGASPFLCDEIID